MPSLRHEILVELFRNRPALAAELLSDALAAPVPPFTEARLESESLTEVSPTEYRADLVVLLLRSTPVLGIVVEVQLGRDEDKRFTWPVYAAGLRARLRCPTCLLVVSPNPEVAAWASQGCEVGPGWSFKPWVLGPGLVPVITESTARVVSPELAVLSAMAHGPHLPTDRAFALAVAAIGAVAGLEEDRALLYYDMVMASLSEAARRSFQQMDLSKYEFQTEFVRRFVAEGRAEGEAIGRAEGEAIGRAEAILRVLSARGISVPDDLRARILACRELETLDRWLGRAAVAETAAELASEG